MNGATSLVVDAFVQYGDVVFVDAEGDGLHHYPHIYVEFAGDNGPYSWGRAFLSIGEEFDIEDGWTKIDFFPKSFSSVETALNLRSEMKIELDAATLKGHLKYQKDAETLFATDDRYAAFSPRDVVQIANTAGGDEPFLRITYVAKMCFGDYLKDHHGSLEVRRLAKQQIGRDINEEEELTIVEASRTYKHEWEPSKS